MKKVVVMSTLFILMMFVISCEKDCPTDSENSEIAGLVLDFETNLGIAEVHIQTNPPTESVYTDADGNFIIDAAADGQYTITALKDEYFPESVNVSVLSGKKTDAVIKMRKVSSNNTPPEIPSNPSPADGAVRKTSDLRLSWYCSDRDGDHLTYDVYFGKNDPPVTLLVTGLDEKFVNISDLDDSTTYYWKVIAKDIYGAVTSSKVWSFSIDKNIAAPDISEGLVAYWNFDDGTASDQSGNGYDGTLMNSPTLVEGHRGNAFHFQSVGYSGDNGQHVLLPRIPFEYYNDFSICLWVNEDSTSTMRGEAFIYFGDHNNGWLGIQTFKIKDNSSTEMELQFAVGAAWDTGTNPVKVQYDPVASRNQWVFYALVYKDNTVYAYRGTDLLGSVSQSVNIATNDAAMARHWWSWSPYTSTGFTGIMDEVRIYDRALTNNELQSLAE